MSADDTTTVERAPIPRDSFGRPRILTPGGKVRSYTRVSTFAKSLSDGDSLTTWKRRVLMRGLVANPGLFDAARQIGSAAELREYDAIIEAAHECGGGQDGAKWGTALHDLAEWFDAEDTDFRGFESTIPKDLLDGLDRYVHLTRDIEMLACEGFVVLDDIGVAGSYDRIGVLPDGRICVLDVKTGGHVHKNVAEVMIQLACYARGTHYHPDGTREKGLLEHVDTSIGVVIQVPRDRTVGDRLMLVDLDKGWELAQLALTVRRERTQKFLALGLEMPPF